MTTADPFPVSGAHPPMASATDSQPDPTAPTATAPAVGAAPGLRAELTDDAVLTIVGAAITGLLTILGMVVVGLLIFTLNGIDNRLSRLGDKMDAGFAAVDARFAAQDARIDELDRKLTAQIDELDSRLTARIDELDLRLSARIDELGSPRKSPSSTPGSPRRSPNSTGNSLR